jgi:hypothetical protein
MQWVVPVYQRHYEWDTGADQQISNFWDDLMDKAEEAMDPERTLYPHYFGAVICSEPKASRFGVTPQRFLIDGQQRITTFNVLLCAVRETARSKALTGMETAMKSYLFNDLSDSMDDPERERFKLWPSSYDRGLFRQIVSMPLDDVKKARATDFYKNGGLIKGQAPKLLVAYIDLLTRIATFLDEKEEVGIGAEAALSSLLEGFLGGFQVVLIELNDHDDAQEIFASLNGLAKPLAPFDLIRNDVFLRSKKSNEDAEALFEGKWKTFESPFWTTEVKQGRMKRARADHLVAHSVVAETGREVSVAKVASEYQRYARDAKFGSVADELDSLLKHAATYRALEEKPEDSIVTPIAKLLEVWDMAVFHPWVLWVNTYVGEQEQKTEIFDLLESYIVRREICRLTPKNYNKVVTTWIRSARAADDVLAAFKNSLESGEGEISRFPRDSEVLDAFSSAPAYEAINSKKLRYILAKLEYAMRTKKDEIILMNADLTIEHIMPQSWHQNWPLPNGESSPTSKLFEVIYRQDVSEETKTLARERASKMHVFGNLTLLNTNANVTLRNSGWGAKQSLFGDSLLALNRKVGTSSAWNEVEIEKRSKELGKFALEVWAATDQTI